MTFDGATVNRSLVKLHQSPCKDVPHKTLNPFSDDQRFFLFFSDAPHLMKTVRNCFMSNRRSLWVSTHSHRNLNLIVYLFGSARERT